MIDISLVSMRTGKAMNIGQALTWSNARIMGKAILDDTAKAQLVYVQLTSQVRNHIEKLTK